MEAVRCLGLSKEYDGLLALDRLSLTVEEGTIFGFLGPNGAGKTTTIKLLTGLTHPTAGQAWVAGHQVTADSRAVHGIIGYLPEEPAFYNWMSGREFLEHVGELFGLPPKVRKSRVDEVLGLVDLVSAAKRRVGGYSRGMRQRLGIAQAMINNPRVLFLDEPASALDPLGRLDVLNVIRALKGQTTVFMSSHILADVERVCDTVSILNHGRLVTQARTEELKEKYAKPIFVLEFEEPVAGLAAKLRALPWVEKVEATETALKVFARDVSTAKRELPQVVASSQIGLLRYELAMPSLEDIFVKLVGDDRQGGQE
jgi:ABC-2 type transport system ATP-binding protein